MKENKLWCVVLGIALFVAACAPQTTTKVQDTPTPTATPTAATPGTPIAPTSTDTPQPGGGEIPHTPPPPTTPQKDVLTCPQVDTPYRLDYVHEVVQDIAQTHIEHVAEPGAAFQLTIRADGTVDSSGFENLVAVTISGKLEDCVLVGDAKLSAEISGQCVGGIASLQITEHWEALSTTVTCPGQDPQSVNVEGFFSAPEAQFDFALLAEGDTQVLDADTGVLAVYYSWTLRE
jgi:hypothetical protein